MDIALEFDSYSTELVDRMLAFAGTNCRARWSTVVWINSDCKIISMQGGNAPSGVERHYQDVIRDLDPLCPKHVAEIGGAVVTLRGSDGGLVNQAAPEYLGYINRFEIGDEANLLFWSGGVLVAGMAMYRGRTDPPFISDERDWEGMRRYFEKSLTSHAFIRRHTVRASLRHRYGLNPREIEVAETLAQGATNAELATTLGISVSTVKNHIVNILNKIGVDNRSSVQAVIATLPYQ